jgi:C1A family cysteine protease
LDQQPVFMNRILNWRPSLPDHRDFSYSSIEHAAAPVKLPSAIDLSKWNSPIMDQGEEGTCAAHAGAACVEYLEMEELRKNLPEAQSPQEYIHGQFSSVSRHFIYYNALALENNAGTDAGISDLRNVCKTLVKQGVCRESVWKYEPKLLSLKPSEAAYMEASQHKAGAYYAIDSIYEVKRCLANGYPVMFGIPLFTSFMSETVARTGIVPTPSKSERMIGGHAMTLIGYSDITQRFLVRNSWGKTFGLNGYCMIPYPYVTDMGDGFATLRRS